MRSDEAFCKGGLDNLLTNSLQEPQRVFRVEGLGCRCRG